MQSTSVLRISRHRASCIPTRKGGMACDMWSSNRARSAVCPYSISSSAAPRMLRPVVQSPHPVL